MGSSPSGKGTRFGGKQGGGGRGVTHSRGRAGATPLQAYAEDLAGKGAFLGIEHFEPSRKAKRLRATASASKAKPVIRDGPFSETKDLLGGFVTVTAASIEEAIRWAERYLEDVETDEIDVRGLVG